MSLDSQVAEALAAAWLARRRLGLPARPRPRRSCAPSTAAPAIPPGASRTCSRTRSTGTHSSTRRTPRCRGRGDLLRRDYRRHLVRFVAGIRRPRRGMGSANLGPGFGFHYNPELPPGTPGNFDTPEYANIVASALQHYPRALRAGMRPLPARDLRLLRRWVARLLTGSWTHAGYLNWDTGHGLRRWHSGQYWAFAQQGLLAIATAPQFCAAPLLRALGQGAVRPRAAPVRALGRGGGRRDRAAAAVRRVLRAPRPRPLRDPDRGERDARGRARPRRRGRRALPPPLYSFDRETHRLAVTTPAYSTAIVPDNRHAFAYGGIELARLFDGRQRVAATTGGMLPHAFGVAVRDAAGATLLASQDGARHDTRLRVLGGRPPGGPFRELRAVGSVAARGLSITTTHRFRARDIALRWDVRCRAGCARPHGRRAPADLGRGRRDRAAAARRRPDAADRPGRARRRRARSSSAAATRSRRSAGPPAPCCCRWRPCRSRPRRTPGRRSRSGSRTVSRSGRQAWPCGSGFDISAP